MSARTPTRKAAAGLTIAILALVVLAADQFSKHLVVTHLEPGVRKEILGEALQFVLVFNPGAAFSFGTGVTWVFTIAMAIVAGVIVFLAATRVRSRLWAVILGLLLGGVLGNLADRLFRDPGFAVGHVVDFILTPWMWFWTARPAIFNVADMFIVCGMAAVAVMLIVGIELDGSRARKKGERAQDDAEDGAEVSDDGAEEPGDAVGPARASAEDDASPAGGAAGGSDHGPDGADDSSGVAGDAPRTPGAA